MSSLSQDLLRFCKETSHTLTAIRSLVNEGHATRSIAPDDTAFLIVRSLLDGKVVSEDLMALVMDCSPIDLAMAVINVGTDATTVGGVIGAMLSNERMDEHTAALVASLVTPLVDLRSAIDHLDLDDPQIADAVDRLSDGHERSRESRHRDSLALVATLRLAIERTALYDNTEV